MIRKAGSLFIVCVLLITLYYTFGVLALSGADASAPVSKVLEIWDRTGAEKLGMCGEAVRGSFLSFKGNAVDEESNVNVAELKRDEDIGGVGWNENSNWAPTTCANCGSSNNVDFFSIAESNSRKFSEGERVVCSRSIDASGNLELVDVNSCCGFCVDTKGPEKVMNVKSVDTGQCVLGYVNSAPKFTWDSALVGGCAGIEYYEVELHYSNGTIVDSFRSEGTEFSVPVEKLINGKSYYVKIRGVDSAGNKGVISDKSSVVVYDNENPKVKLSMGGIDGWVREDFIVNESDSDNLGLFSCEYRTTNGGDVGNWTKVNCNLAFGIDVSSSCPNDGKCVVEKRATDRACNVGQDSREFKVDANSPNTTKIISEPKIAGTGGIDWFITDRTGVSFSCSDGNGVGCDKTVYRIKGESGNWSSWIAFNGSALKFAKEGKYFVEYYSEDLLGNKEGVKSEIDKVDLEAPVSIKSEKPVFVDNSSRMWIGANTIFNISAVDEGVGVQGIFYRINSGGWKVYNGTFSLGSVCGESLIEYYSEDLLGNTEKVKNQTVMMDCDSPSIIILNPSLGEREIEKCSQSVVALVNDSGTGVKKVWAELWNGTSKVREVVMASSVYGTYEAMMDKQLPAGNYTLKVKVQDNAGNVKEEDLEEHLLNSVFVESITPSICSINPLVGGTCDFTFNVCMRGGDSIKFWMDKLGAIVTPSMMNASVSKGSNSTFVGLLDDGVNAGLLNFGKGVINGRDSFSLKLKVSSSVAGQIGAGSHKLNYLIKSYKN